MNRPRTYYMTGWPRKPRSDRGTSRRHRWDGRTLAKIKREHGQ